MTREEILKDAKPILFNTNMVRAILDGRKTVTRRVMKPQPLFYTRRKYIFADDVCPKKWEDCDNIIETYQYQAGDILYVRETWNFVYDMDGNEQIIEKTGRYVYYADDPMPFSYWVDTEGEYKDMMPWRPSIHMPKEAARIFLRVTDVRVERLQDITDEQAKAEGANFRNGKNVGWEEKMRRTAVERFAEIWNSTIKKSDLGRYGWEASPWVWVIEFERVMADENVN